MPAYIAFYGSLKKGHGVQRQLVADHQLTLVGSCLIPGKLFDLGEYPGMTKGTGTVRGELYRIEDMSVLRVLDQYEEYDECNPNASLFVRQSVLLRKPKRNAWVYIYNGQTLDKRQIEAGDWTAYEKQRRLQR